MDGKIKHRNLWDTKDTLYNLRESPEWREWRTHVFKRDRYTCQLCGKRGGRMHPHHIISKMLFPDYVFRVMNGITLCYKCHMEKGVHREKNNRYVRRFARRTQLKLPRAKRYHITHKE